MPAMCAAIQARESRHLCNKRYHVTEYKIMDLFRTLFRFQYLVQIHERNGCHVRLGQPYYGLT